MYFVTFATDSSCVKITSDASVYEERVFLILEKVRTPGDKKPQNLFSINRLVWGLLMKITIFV